MADEPVTLEMMLVTNANYNHGDADWDRSIIAEVEKAIGAKLDITCLSSVMRRSVFFLFDAFSHLKERFPVGKDHNH